jgi:hypothetical protein
MEKGFFVLCLFVSHCLAQGVGLFPVPGGGNNAALALLPPQSGGCGVVVTSSAVLLFDRSINFTSRVPIDGFVGNVSECDCDGNGRSWRNGFCRCWG